MDLDGTDAHSQSDHQSVPDLSDLVPPYIATLDELSGRSNCHANFVKVL